MYRLCTRPCTGHVHCELSYRHGPKEGGGADVPFSRELAGTLSSTMWPGPRFTAIPSGVFIHPAIWPQYGPDELSAEHLVNAHPILVMHLCALFRAMLFSGCVPDGFGIGTIIPLPVSYTHLTLPTIYSV